MHLGGERHRESNKSVLPKNTTQYPQPGLKPRALTLESNALTMRPPHLHIKKFRLGQSILIFLPCYIFQMWAHPCAHVIFDTDPTPRGRGGPAEEEEMSQALIRSVVTNSPLITELTDFVLLWYWLKTGLHHSHTCQGMQTEIMKWLCKPVGFVSSHTHPTWKINLKNALSRQPKWPNYAVCMWR